MTTAHLWLAVVVILSNTIAALMLGLAHRRGQAPGPAATLALWAGRASLLLQIALGLTLTARGYVGVMGHYLAALAALAALWYSARAAARSPRPLPVQSLGAAASALLALAALALALSP